MIQNTPVSTPCGRTVVTETPSSASSSLIGKATVASRRKTGTGTIFSSTTSTFGNNVTSNRATVGADAHFGVATTWDFYQSLGRTGIAGDGKGSYSRTHVGRGYVNAFWSDSGFCMSYCDGDGVTYSPLVDFAKAVRSFCAFLRVPPARRRRPGAVRRLDCAPPPRPSPICDMTTF